MLTLNSRNTRKNIKLIINHEFPASQYSIGFEFSNSVLAEKQDDVDILVWKPIGETLLEGVFCGTVKAHDVKQALNLIRSEFRK